MAEIKTLHLVPREGMQVSEKPSVVRVRFGDGYEQRRPTGLNARLKTFQAVFRVTDEPTRRWLDEFLSWHGGYRAFLWRPPKHNLTVRVCAGSGASQITPGTVISVVRLSRW